MKYPETARRLAEALNDKNLKPIELAEKADVSKGSISQYMNGRNRPTNMNAGKMAKVLDVDPMWLMGFDVEKKCHTYVLISGNEIQVVEEMKDMSEDQKNRVLAYAQFIKAYQDKRKGDKNVD